MREFNLEEAKQGKPVCTRDGRPARIICFDRIEANYPIIALIHDGNTEIYLSYNEKGKWLNKSYENYNDLYMVGEKHTGYVNIWKTTENILECGNVYESEEEAINSANNYCFSYKKHIATIKIEWNY